MKLGERIERRRMQLGLSQRKLAQKCGGMAPSIISRLESSGAALHGGVHRGTEPGPETLRKLAAGLACLPEYLIGTRQDYMQSWARSLPTDRLLAMGTPQLRLNAVVEELQTMYGEEGSIHVLAAQMRTSSKALLADDHADSFWAELSALTGVPVEFFTPAAALDGAFADYRDALSLAVEMNMSPTTLREVIQRWGEQQKS